MSLTTAKSLGVPSLPPPVNAVILLKSESNFNVLLSIKMSDAHTKVRFVDVETYLKNVKKKKKKSHKSHYIEVNFYRIHFFP